MDSSDNTTWSKKTSRAWGRKILFASVLAATPFLGACANSVKESAQFGTGGGPQHPVVLSGSPARDSLANAAADQQLSETDWRLLEQLG